ncbi:hypothetical protein ACHAXR_003236 [Thalassiosira sp. AJA248-18]
MQPDGIIVVNTNQIHTRIGVTNTAITSQVDIPVESATPNNHTVDSATAQFNSSGAVENAGTNSSHTAKSSTTRDDNADEMAAANINQNEVGGSSDRILQHMDVVDNSIEMVDNVVRNNEDDDIIRSRKKSDIWHEFRNTPLDRKCPASPSINILLRMATLTINELEEQRVQYYLASRGVTDFDEHFFFNKEWWYKRVRMPPRKGIEASDNLMTLLNYFKTNEVYKEYLTPEVEKHVRGWAFRCRSGRYEDLPDVEMYKHKGYDRNGLDLWQRERGSSKVEGFYQKMEVAAGSFGFGVETAHYLQNIRDIWGVTLFTNRINVSEYKMVDFVSVGVGPLSFNENYVKMGEPGDGIKGDLFFMPERMRVKYPPLPPCTKKEFGMIKTFCANHPHPKQAEIQQLCKRFNAESNGIDIFPKLPSMIKPAIKKWKINQEGTLLRLRTKASFNEIFEKFRSSKVYLAPPQIQNQPRCTTSVQGATNAAESERLSRNFTQPLSAPLQTRFIPPSNSRSLSKRKLCAFWPLCSKDVNECDGVSMELCKVYGRNGTKPAPSKAELEYQKRLCTWSEKTKTQPCYWNPFCNMLAIECGGINKASCSKYGTNGTETTPSDVALKKKKQEVNPKAT